MMRDSASATISGSAMKISVLPRILPSSQTIKPRESKLQAKGSRPPVSVSMKSSRVVISGSKQFHVDQQLVFRGSQLTPLLELTHPVLEDTQHIEIPAFDRFPDSRRIEVERVGEFRCW